MILFDLFYIVVGAILRSIWYLFQFIVLFPIALISLIAYGILEIISTSKLTREE